MVFMTASPVLTNEVKRFYANLKSTLKSHLQQKEHVRAEIEKRKEFQLVEGAELLETATAASGDVDVGSEASKGAATTDAE